MNTDSEIIKDIESVVLRAEQAAKYLGISRRTLDEMHERDPSFPRKIYYSSRAVFFRRKSLDNWLAHKEANGCLVSFIGHYPQL